MTRRRPIRQPKKRVYLGCEGNSEASYAQFINDMLRADRIPIHLEIEPLAPGAGDPLARVQRALKRIVQLERRRSGFSLKMILMDSDQAAEEPQRGEEAQRLAARNDIGIIWQDPCHEAMLLRHMPGCSDRRPQTCLRATQLLTRVWPEYRKPMARVQLARRMGIEAVRQASGVEPILYEFLQKIRLIN